jgi:eukaryotic-like serine/threonine-protein kinase
VCRARAAVIGVVTVVGLSRLIPGLPLPLAQLLARSLNAKSAEERHNCAYYLGESTLKLSCAARAASWLRFRAGTDRRVADQSESLLLPTTGDWLRLLQHTSRSLAAFERAGRLVPFADTDAGLSRRRSDWEHIPAFAAAALNEGAVSQQAATEARRQGAFGFFALLVAYRNRVLGHGAQRLTSFYERLGPLLLQAVVEVLEQNELFTGFGLIKAVSKGGEDLDFLQLSGLSSTPMATPELDAPASPGHLYLSAGKTLLPLDPLVVHETDELDRERVGFLNGTVRRVLRKEGEIRIRRVDYLDYATGEVLAGFDTQAALERLVARLRGRDLGAGEREEIERRSVDRAVFEGEERVTTGEIVDDFEILRELGRGGMGTVYLAQQLGLERQVALKVLHPAYAGDEVMSSRFRRETKALGMSDHPNVVRILSSGQEGDRIFFAMEYVHGADLSCVAELLATKNKEVPSLTAGHLLEAVAAASDPAAAAERAAAPEKTTSTYYKAIARLFAGAARGLHHLHELGVVHRDVKPGNLMLTADAGSLVITDLGLAKMSEVSRDLSRSQAGFLGTLRYMAPEQLQRNLLEVDGRADAYGLGAALYELSTLRPLFDGDTEQRLVQQVLVEDPVAPRKAQPEIPRDLASIISVATAKRAGDRYSTAEDLAIDLEAFAGDYPIRARPPGPLRRGVLLARRRPVPVVVAAALLVIAAITGTMLPRGPKLETGSFGHVYERWGALVGDSAIDEETASRRGSSYTVETEDGRTRTVSLMNGSGELKNDDDGIAVWRHGYTETGHLHRIVCEDRSGNVIKSRVFDWAGPREVKVRVLDRFGMPLKSTESDVQSFFAVKQGADVFGSKLVLDEQGLVLRRTYHSAGPFGQPRQGEDGSWGVRFEREPGRVQPARATHLGPDGEDQPNRNGVAFHTHKRDDHGNVIERGHFAQDGTPILDQDGSAGFVARYDESGNLIEQTFIGLNGAPTLVNDGIARRVAKYDDRGNWVEVRFFDAVGKLTLCKDGNAGWRARHDERGNAVERSFFGLEGELVILSNTLYASERMEYNERGDLVAVSFYEPAGKPTLDSNGAAGWQTVTDERGRRIRTTNIGLDGKPTRDKRGISAWTVRYDDRGSELERSYFGPGGEQDLARDGCSTIRNETDERGNKVSTRCFGLDGALALNEKGCAGWNKRYDDGGHLVEDICVDVNGRPAPSTEGPARTTVRYDRHGQPTEFSCFDSEGRPATFQKTGAARFVAEHDDRGRETRFSFFGADEKPTATADGYASRTTTYDDRGNVVEEAFFGVDGKPTLHKEGYALTRARYDKRGRRVEVSYFGLQGEPTLNAEGNASYRTSYDDRGFASAKDYLGLDGRPTLQRKGYAGIRFKRDPRGNVLEQTTVGVDGGPTLTADGYATQRSRYDRHDRAVENSYLGKEGRLVLRSDGYASQINRYDERGHLVEATTFGIDGRPVATSQGYARGVQSFDNRGNVTGVELFGPSGERSRNRSGAFGWRVELDDHDREVRRTYLGPDGEPAAVLGGYVVLASEYDSRGRVVAQSYLDLDGRLVRGPTGFAKTTIGYDDRGSYAETTLFGPDGRPTLGPAGWAAVKSTFDERGNRVEKAFFGVDGKAIAERSGVAVGRFEFDAFGREISHTYFDVQGRRVNGVSGFWRHRVFYDERGNVVEERYFDTLDAPINNAGGYHVARTTRDAFGTAVQIEHLDVAGRLVFSAITDSRKLEFVESKMAELRHGQPELLHGASGVLVTGLIENSNGMQAGINVGDIVVRYDGAGISNNGEILAAIARVAGRDPTHKIPVLLVRGTRNLTVEVSPGRLGIMLKKW